MMRVDIGAGSCREAVMIPGHAGAIVRIPLLIQVSNGSGMQEIQR